jgi:hypothetical protein
MLVTNIENSKQTTGYNISTDVFVCRKSFDSYFSKLKNLSNISIISISERSHEKLCFYFFKHWNSGKKIISEQRTHALINKIFKVFNKSKTIKACGNNNFFNFAATTTYINLASCASVETLVSNAILIKFTIANC